jgi:hypothetical protein
VESASRSVSALNSALSSTSAAIELQAHKLSALGHKLQVQSCTAEQHVTTSARYPVCSLQPVKLLQLPNSISMPVAIALVAGEAMP